eukprot:2862377-Alexandrium_andersonii.AAC.1
MVAKACGEAQCSCSAIACDKGGSSVSSASMAERCGRREVVLMLASLKLTGRSGSAPLGCSEGGPGTLASPTRWPPIDQKRGAGSKNRAEQHNSEPADGGGPSNS